MASGNQHSLALRTNFSLEVDEQGKLILNKIDFVRHYL